MLVLIDLGAGRNRLGGSVLAQVYGQTGDEAPDVDSPAKLKAFFETIQQLNAAGRDAGLSRPLRWRLVRHAGEMMFASHVGVTVDIGALGDDALAALFNEELGAVLQVEVDGDSTR